LTGTARPRTARSRAREATMIVEILSGKSVADAATAAGCSRRTGYRVVASESFQRAYRAAKAELLSGAVASLHRHAMTFIETLHTIATDPKAQASARVQASREGISGLFKAVEVFDIAERLAKLEAIAGQEQQK
jgi:hypothetical protein